MIGAEWDITTALEVEREEGFEKGHEEGREEGFEEGREEGFEEGREEGFEEGRAETARNMLRNGFSYEQTAELSMLDIEKVKKLSYTIQA